MEEVLAQRTAKVNFSRHTLTAYSQLITMDKSASVVLDIESLAQALDITSGSPKTKKVLSRKGSCRLERRCGNEEDEIEETTKKLLVKMNSHLEPLISTKNLSPVTAANNGSNLTDTADGRSKRFNRLIPLNPKKILLIFATMSSIGTMILIYFTLAIYMRS